MSVLSKLKHSAWSGVVLSLVLAICSTFSPDLIRGILLFAAVVAAIWTFYLTEYGGRNAKKTVFFGIGCTIVALVVFAVGRAFDAKAKVIPVQASGGEQQTNSQSGPIEQKSQGANSPNTSIVGNNNAVTIYPEHSSAPQPTFREKAETVSFSLGEGGITDSEPVERLRKQEYKPFNFGGYFPVALRMKGETLLLHFEVWGGNNKPPIEIRDNEFTVRVPGWDRNSNANALEVVNADGAPVFQMILKSSTRVAVNGIFPSPSGLIIAGPEGFESGPSPAELRAFHLRPIFKYPGWKYPGQYAE